MTTHYDVTVHGVGVENLSFTLKAPPYWETDDKGNLNIFIREFECVGYFVAGTFCSIVVEEFEETEDVINIPAITADDLFPLDTNIAADSAF